MMLKLVTILIGALADGKLSSDEVVSIFKLIFNFPDEV